MRLRFDLVHSFSYYLQFASWIPGILTNLGIVAYGAIKVADHQRPATRVIASGCLSLFSTIGSIASFWLLIRGSSRRIGLYSFVSFGFQVVHIAATILLVTAVFMDRKPRNEATQSFPPQMR